MKSFVFFLFTTLSLTSFSQSFTEKLYFDLNLGTRIGGAVSNSSTLGAGFHIDGGAAYELNELYAVKADLGFDTYKATSIVGSVADRSLGIRASLQGVVNISDLASFSTDVFGLKFHGGLGLYSVSNPSFKDSYIDKGGNFDDPVFKGNDDMLNFIFGLNPQYHLSDKLSVNADLSLILLTNQSNYVDRAINKSVNEGTGSLINASVGVSFRL
jgi:OOP family OmpA-OmpF porin